jgi:hypothetical protein
MGIKDTVYTSIPSDAVGGCPPTYTCNATTTNYRRTDGLGWIPVPFSNIQQTTGTIFSSLPIDPINTTSGGFFYTYVPGNSWALSSPLESEKYISQAQNDGGATTTRFELGSDLELNVALAPVIQQTACGDGDTSNMVSYWKLDETSVGQVADARGVNNGTNNGATPTQGKVAGAYFFNGTSNVVNSGATLNMTNEVTIEAWVKINSCPTGAGGANPPIAGKQGPGNSGYTMIVDGGCGVVMLAYTAVGLAAMIYGYLPPSDTWHYVAGTYKNGEGAKIYVDGVKSTNAPAINGSGMINSSSYNFSIGGIAANNQYFPGTIDEVAVYDHALTGPTTAQNCNTSPGRETQICQHYLRSNGGNHYCPYTP